MTYLDINQEKNILDELVITKFENLIPLLKNICENKNINQNNLRKKSKISGGKIYHSVKAMKVMELVENGAGLTITNLGKRFLDYYNHDKKDFKEILKIACLNAPIFNKIYQENSEVKDPKKLYNLFETELAGRYEGINQKLIGSSVRRYLYGIHNIKLRTGARFYFSKNQTNLKGYSKKKKASKEIIEVINDFKEVLGLSNEELHKMINSLPEEKKERFFSQIFSKVFN